MRWTSLLLCLIFTSCTTVGPVTPPVDGADPLDTFGGWTLKQASTITTTNRNADGSAHATSVTPTTLTDTSQNWVVNSLQGYNLQPDVSENMFIEIVSNTSDTITVLESDRTAGEYRGIDNYNSGTDEYRVLNDWPSEKIDDKYWIISPQDNVFLIQGINNFWDGLWNNGMGEDPHGYTLAQVLAYKYGSTEPNEMYRIPDLKGWGFNSLIEFVNPLLYPGADADVTSEYWLPYLPTIRPSLYWTSRYSWAYASTVEILTNNVFHDVFDEDFITAIQTTLENGGAYSAMGETQQAHHLTPYNLGWKNCAGNPYCMGLKIEDEPSAGSADGPGYCQEYNSGTGLVTWGPCTSTPDLYRARANHGYVHSGFHNFVNRIRNGNETSQTKAFFVNWLRAKYSDGGEDTFLANIAFGGTDEVALYSAWSGVGGYVSAAKDTAALGNLNNAWTTSYASWEEVYKSDNSDHNDTKTGSSNISFVDSNPDTIVIAGDTWAFSPTPGYIKVSGTASNDGLYEVMSYTTTTFTLDPTETLTAEANTSAQLDTIGEIYGRVFNNVGAAITNIYPNGDYSSPISSAPTTILSDMNEMAELYWRRWATTFSDWFDTKFYGKKLLMTFKQDLSKDIHEKEARWRGFMSDDYTIKYFDAMIPMGDSAKASELSGATDMPIWTNSSWTSADLDFHRSETGTVEEIQYTVLIRGVTDASGNTGTTVTDTDTSDTVVVDRATYHGATTLDITSNACGDLWCATVFCNIDADPDVCSDVEFYADRAGAVWNGAELVNQIIIKDAAANGNAINYELRSYNVLYDSVKSFFDAFTHDNMHRRLWGVSGSEMTLANKSYFDGTGTTGMSCRTPNLLATDDPHKMKIVAYCQGGYYACGNTTGRTCYGERCTNLNHWLPAGTTYIISKKLERVGCTAEDMLTDTQEDRATEFYDIALSAYRSQNSDGDYNYLGKGWFNIWDTGGGSNEPQNFGWFTTSDNAFDAVEATVIGADGLPDTRDDEQNDYGDFIGGASQFTEHMYSLTYPLQSVGVGSNVTVENVILKGVILK